MRRLAFVVLLFLLWAPGAYAWTWPAQGPVLLGFTFDPSHPYAGGQHRGIDIGVGTGTPVVAPASGAVTFAGTVPTSGKSVTIATGDGYSVTLTHLGSIAVSKGASVAEGDAIGTVGPSGTPELDVPYVYMGVRVTAEAQGYLDPLSFLPALPPPVPVAPPPPPQPPAPAPAQTEVAAPPPPVETVTTLEPPTAPVSDTAPVSGTVPDASSASATAPEPEATSAPDSGAGDMTEAAPTTEAPSAAAPASDAAPPTPDATSAPTSGAGDLPDPAPTVGAPASDMTDTPPASDTTAAPLPQPEPMVRRAAETVS
jgi:hypothetical protein